MFKCASYVQPNLPHAPQIAVPKSLTALRAGAERLSVEVCVMSGKSCAVVELEPVQARPRRGQSAPKPQPRYHVVLWNDEDHTIEYVIHLIRSLFGQTRTMGRKIASEVHNSGRAVCLTTTREHAELKRDQIHAFGRDRCVDHCLGSMWATIEPETG